MDSRRIADQLLRLAALSRGSGRTRVGLHLAAAVDGVYVCAANNEAHNLPKMLNLRVKTTSLENLESLFGQRRPVIIDHHATEVLVEHLMRAADRDIQYAVHATTRAEEDARSAQRENDGLRGRIQKLENTVNLCAARVQYLETELELSKARVASLLGVDDQNDNQGTNAGAEDQKPEATGGPEVPPAGEPKD